MTPAPGRLPRLLPDLLTASRFLAAVVMLAPGTTTVGFLLCFGWCALSDVLDGWLARRLAVASVHGAHLDSAADLVHWLAVTAYLVWRTQVPTAALVVAVLVLAVVRLTSAVTGRLRSGRWGMVHTLANKASGLLLTVWVPVAVWTDRAPPVATALVLLVAYLAAAEELMLVVRQPDLDPDDPGPAGRLLSPHG